MPRTNTLAYFVAVTMMKKKFYDKDTRSKGLGIDLA
jgi:hypothetical protein